jgi:biotin synthase
MEEETQISPDWVRISMAAAMELGLKPGRINGCRCGCINLLQSYPEGCYANCSYCGLARERPGAAEDNTFIRVAWPLFRTDLVAAKIGEKDIEFAARGGIGRVCIAQVQDARAYEDLVAMTRTVRAAAPGVPISALVSAPTLNEERLGVIQDAGADIIGIGLDAASQKLFHDTRGRGVRGPHQWDQHWEIARAARRMYGAFNVNFHVVVGLGETDQELVDLFYELKEEEIAAYIFSFNPEPGTAMEDVPRAPIERTRRVQLAKHLIESDGVERGSFAFDESGAFVHIGGPESLLNGATDSGTPFMTDGCPDRAGKVACNRPYGSYRPSEEYRDYPFQPQPADLDVIRSEMKIEEVRGGVRAT